MSVTVYCETAEGFENFKNGIRELISMYRNGATSKERLLYSVRKYLATHPINENSARLSRITLSDPCDTIIDEIEQYIERRKDTDYSYNGSRNPYWMDEDIASINTLQETLNECDCYTAPYERLMYIVSKYLVTVKHNDATIYLRDALVAASESDVKENIKAYIRIRLTETYEERRNNMTRRGSFTMEDCLNSNVAIVTQPNTLDDALTLEHDVKVNCYLPYKVALIREYIANHEITPGVSTLSWISFEHMDGVIDRSERIDELVHEFVEAIAQGQTYQYVNRPVEQGENLLRLAKDLKKFKESSMLGVFGDDAMTAETLQRKVAIYLTNNYTDKTTFWLRAALLVPVSGCAQYVEKYLEDRRFSFPFEQNEIEELLGMNERRSEMTNENVDGVVDTQVEQAYDENADENVRRCSWCGVVIDEDSASYDVNDGNEVICHNCYTNAVECEDCNRLYPEGDIHRLRMADDSVRTVCEGCMDNYAECSGCGHWIDKEDDYSHYSESDSEWYCEDCYNDRFTCCDNCGEEIYRDDVYEYHGDYYCEYCYNERCSESVIYDYHDFDSSDYHTMFGKDEEHGNQLTFGIELEIGGDCDTAEGLLDIMNGGRFDTVHLEEDGSVDGYEMITNPMTRQFYEEEFKPLLEKGLEYLRKHGMRGHGQGGMHIHFTEIDNRAQLMRMIRVLYGDVTAVELWEQISQRGVNNMGWCKLMNYRTRRTEEILKGEYKVATGSGDDHNNGLNHDPYRTHTHELRIFNSNLRFDRFCKNMEVLFSLLDYTSMGGKSIRVDVYSYLDYVRAHRDDYINLHNFLTEKKLWTFGQVIPDELYENDTCDVVTAYSLPRQLPINDEFELEVKIPEITEEDMKIWSAEIDRTLAEA